MSSFEDLDPEIKEIKKFTVGIKKTDGVFLGTGIIATEGGIIVTCYHILRIEGSQKIRQKVRIYFPSTSNQHYESTATILEDDCDPRRDRAFLQLSDKKIPRNAKLAPFSTFHKYDTKFKSFGFRKPEDFIGLPAEGVIKEFVSKRIKNKGGAVRPDKDTINHFYESRVLGISIDLLLYVFKANIILLNQF